MNTFLALILLFTVTACGSDKQHSGQQVEPSSEPIPVAACAAIEDPYSIDLNIEKSENDDYNLIVSLELDEGSYFYSPFTSDFFKGNFTIIIDDTANLNLSETILESPASELSKDRSGSHPVNIVTENTTYTQQIMLANTADFEVSGKIRFVIEPKCTMEEIPFYITYRSGKMVITKNGC
jgi:hypothetical protein